MLALLIIHLVAALVAPLLVRWWGPRACQLLALAPAAALGWAVAVADDVRHGDPPVETYSWVGQLGLDPVFRVGTLSWLMVLLVGGIGALVLVYCGRYLGRDEPGLGRFAAVLVAFAGAMLLLVMSDNLLLLYVGWELTTVFSYLLIGHDPQRRSSRWAAAQALTVTTFGGLAMLVGFIMIGGHAGTYRLSELDPARLPSGGHLVVAVLLVLAGALSKSAVVPFSSWLPAAMAAPTPVSAYLHAAAMVKAGVYLVALLGPVLATTGPWRPVTFVAGTVTMLAAGWAALRQTDLKLLLAYGTVSQLGLMSAAAGAGNGDAALAATALLLAHALFKATLFLVVGVIDHECGTRDLRELSGLWRVAPALAVVGVLAAASMAGLPPLFGFVAKEALFHAYRHQTGAVAVLVAGTVLTVAYSARFVWGAFATRPGVRDTGWHRVPVSLLGPPAALAVAGLLFGPYATRVGELLEPYAALFPGGGYHLALWHGPTAALGLSAVAVAGGVLLFVLRGPLVPVLARLRFPVDGTRGYEWLVHRLDRLAIEVTGATQRGSLPQYLGTVLVVLVAVPGGVLLVARPWPDRFVLWNSPLQPVVALIMVVAAVLVVRARRRLTAMLLVGVTGYGTAMMFVLYGAPDVALTQFIVETATIAVFVLILRRLPPLFSERPLRRSRWARRAVGAATGLVLAGMALAAAGGRKAPPISDLFPALAVRGGFGRNVVNVTLVDLRAWDTMGEMAVLVAAATGVASLVFERSRVGPHPRRRRGPEPQPRQGRRLWLRGGPTLHGRRRSIVFEVVTRLIFHTIVLFSLFLLFSGHNAPGGGFAGGLVVSLALTVRYLAGGRYELRDAAPVGAGTVLGAGLGICVGTGFVALLVGGNVLESTKITFSLPVVGDFYLVTSLFFDIGVYLVVVGLVLDILRSLGAEVDRQIEASGDPTQALATEQAFTASRLAAGRKVVGGGPALWRPTGERGGSQQPGGGGNTARRGDGDGQPARQAGGSPEPARPDGVHRPDGDHRPDNEPPQPRGETG